MNIYRPYLEQFDSNFVWRLLFVLCSIALIIAASDAFASGGAASGGGVPVPSGGTGGAGDPVGDMLCKMIAIFRGNTARGIAVIGIVVLGIQTLRGQLKWEVALVIITGVIILFKAPEIITMIAGGADTCSNKT